MADWPQGHGEGTHVTVNVGECMCVDAGMYDIMTTICALQ